MTQLFKALTNHSIPSFKPYPVSAEHLKIAQFLFFTFVSPMYSEILKKQIGRNFKYNKLLLQSLRSKDPNLKSLY